MSWSNQEEQMHDTQMYEKEKRQDILHTLTANAVHVGSYRDVSTILNIYNTIQITKWHLLFVKPWDIEV